MFVSFVIGILLVRDSIVGISIPSSISLPTSLFTRYVMHPANNSLVTFLARLIVMCITERAQRYLSDNQSDKLQSWSMPTQQTPSKTSVEHLYNHPVTLWHLVAHKVFLRYSGVAWSHSHRNMYSYGESNSSKLNDHHAKLTDGSSQSHHSLMMWLSVSKPADLG